MDLREYAARQAQEEQERRFELEQERIQAQQKQMEYQRQTQQQQMEDLAARRQQQYWACINQQLGQRNVTGFDAEARCRMYR
jgi:shikimate kinase